MLLYIKTNSFSLQKNSKFLNNLNLITVNSIILN